MTARKYVYRLQFTSVRERNSVRPIKIPEDAATAAREWLMDYVGGEPCVEYFFVLCLDNRTRWSDTCLISSGCLNGTLVHPREVFTPAVYAQAAALVLCHNHPSGDPTPSHEDRALTKRLVSAGSVMGISVMDHVIIGSGRSYFSFKEHDHL